jgi:pimeloyl-ACP methyl ester carboxylesterase
VRAVLLPGLDGTGELFADLVATAPSGIQPQIVAYPPDEPLGYDACARQVLRQLEAGVPFVLVAESFSGPVAVKVAERNPMGLLGVVLCNTFVLRPAWRGFRRLPWRLLVRFPIGRLGVRCFLTGTEHANDWARRIRSANGKVSANVLANRIWQALSVDLREAFKGIPVPVLFLRGTEDNLIGRKSLAEAIACKPDMSVVEMPGPHLLLQTEPRRCWLEVERFIETRCSP